MYWPQLESTRASVSGVPETVPKLAGEGPQVALSIAVLVFGLFIVGAQVLVMLKREKGWGPSSNQIVGLTLVLTAGLFLVVAGYSQDQIAPMMALLGTIAGYLLGRGTDKSAPLEEGPAPRK